MLRYVFSVVILLAPNLYAAQESQRIPISVNATVPARDGLISKDARGFHKLWWTSQFKQGVRSNPDGVRELAFRRYMGPSGQYAENMKTVNDAIIRYGKHVPGYGTGFGFIEEFAKDSRKWEGGIEEKKTALASAVNRCPECLDHLAAESYEIMRKQAAGKSLSRDEQVFYDGLKELVNSGTFLGVTASHKALIERSNPNDVNTWRFHRQAAILSMLSNLSEAQFRKLMTESSELKHLFSQNLADLKDGVKSGFLSVRDTLDEVKQTVSDKQQRESNIRQLEQQLFEAGATVTLVGTLFRLSGREDEGGKVVGVANATLSAYQAIKLHLEDPQRMSRLAASATTMNSFLLVVEIVGSLSRDDENQYVMQALTGIRDQIRSLQTAVERIDKRLAALATAVDLLEQNSNAQYSSLSSAIHRVIDMETGEQFRDWKTEREKVLEEIIVTLSRCRGNFPAGWSYSSARSEARANYRIQCLLPLLQKAVYAASRPGLMEVPKTDMSQEGQARLLDLSVDRGLPIELWIAQVGASLPSIHKSLDGAEASTPPSLFDVEIWYEAVRAYAAARTIAPTYAPSATREEDRELYELERTAWNLGQNLDEWLRARLTTQRFNIAVESYRVAAMKMLEGIIATSEAFMEQKRAVWCTSDSLKHLIGDNPPSHGPWIANACELAVGDRSTSFVWRAGEKQFVLSKGGPLFPVDILILTEDFVDVATRISQGKPATPGGVGSSAEKQLIIGRSGWFSTNEQVLLHGLRTVSSAHTVLRQLMHQTGYSDASPFVATLPTLKGTPEFWDCVRDQNMLLQSQELNKEHEELEASALKTCSDSALGGGCTEFSHSMPLLNFKFKRCDGPIILEDYHFEKEIFKTRVRARYDWRAPLVDVTNYRNSNSGKQSFGLRRYGISAAIGPGDYCEFRPKAETEQCIIDPPWRDRPLRSDYVVSIVGIGNNGVFSKEATFRKDNELATPDYQVEETFYLGHLYTTISSIYEPLLQLRGEWVDFLAKADTEKQLRPLYNNLNRAYSHLLIHAQLHLQMSVLKSDGLSGLINLPISGDEIARAIRAGQIPPGLAKRLLIANDSWKGPFPNILQMKATHTSQLLSFGCAAQTQDINFDGDVTGILVRRRNKPEAGSDLYCRFWQEQFEARQADVQDGGPLLGFHIIFPRGSLFLKEGLGHLAHLQNVQVVKDLKRELRSSGKHKGSVSRKTDEDSSPPRLFENRILFDSE